MSKQDIRDAYEARKEYPACPVVVLGHDRGVVFYLTAAGQMLAIRMRDHNSRSVIEYLFGGNTEWLEGCFPITGKKKSIVDWDLAGVRQWLFQQAHAAGFFDPDRDRRGPGVWRDGGGGLVVHCGDAVRLPDAAWESAGQRFDGKIYPKYRALSRPADQAAEAALGRDLVEFLRSWNWLSPPIGSGLLAPQLFAGWLGCAVVPGALKWRPHIYLTGDKGTGKSHLFMTLAAILGEDWVENASAPSAAGIRQMLNGSARAVLIDEIEHDADNMRAKELVELARLGSTEGQGKIYRGSAEGRAMSWAIRAVFLFSGINPPPFRSQDASRITVLELGELDRDPEAAARIDRAIEFWREHGPALRARIIAEFPRFLDNLHIYRHALSDAGADSRQCDQFGALLAMHDVLVGAVPTEFEAAAKVAHTLMPSELVPSEDEANHWACINHLLTTSIEYQDGYANRKRRTIGQLVAEEIRANSAEIDRELGTRGLKVVERVKGDPEKRYLVIANGHRGLEELFQQTQWHSGAWSIPLSRLPHACKFDIRPRFAGVRQRGVWIPVGVLNLTDDDDAGVEGDNGPVDINKTG